MLTVGLSVECPPGGEGTRPLEEILPSIENIGPRQIPNASPWAELERRIFGARHAQQVPANLQPYLEERDAVIALNARLSAAEAVIKGLLGRDEEVAVL